MERDYRLVYCKARICSDSFVDRHCYQFYERRMLCRLSAYRLRLYSYCLLPREIFLLISAPTPGSVERYLGSLNDSYSAYYQRRFDRQGRVWDDRPTQTALRAGAALLDLHKAIERQPIQRRLCSHPGNHYWSSYSHNAFGRSALLSSYPLLDEMRSGPKGSYRRYREFIASGFAPQYEQSLSRALRSDTKDTNSPQRAASTPLSAPAVATPRPDMGDRIQ